MASSTTGIETGSLSPPSSTSTLPTSTALSSTSPLSSSSTASSSSDWSSSLEPLSPSHNPLTSSALQSLARSLPTYLAVGGGVSGVLILIALGGWWYRRRRRMNRFGKDEEFEEEWKVRSRRGDLEKGEVGGGDGIPVKTSISFSCEEVGTEDSRQQGYVTPTESSPNLSVHVEGYDTPSPSSSPMSSPMSSRMGSHEDLVKKREEAKMK
ncbi:hypothetical protein I302_103925 [Kwoniella bestiolae CBS 10118]|uniref:Uncharacterized protein n=1 Tax=Kwoniella bestiolae CBS 10118 TaxID=1296100 RepID=A0A1B9G9V3_9TREE|nr:hypothetical protein I302_02630 [Kwoniella bestiolae CBS 10118]OCF27781.1 hypothetical protein I302_02630 [Kwoniella bestiolae CBS 10118]